MADSYQQIKLYFDTRRICLGGVANDWWHKDFYGNYWASDYFWLPVGYNPTGKSLNELSQFMASNV